MASTPYGTGGQPVYPIPQMDAQAAADRHGTLLGQNDLQYYGHLFDDIEADKADMAIIEAAVRAA